MEYSGDGVSVYAEAKGEYTRQLCQFLTPALQKYFLDLLDVAKEREADPKKHLLAFQTLLEGISEWNVDKVGRETQSVAMSSQCDYLEELLTAVFIAHTKVLSAIRLTNKQKKLQITIPKLEHFLHRTMTECARLLWKDAHLFANQGSSIERQKNMRQVENLIGEGVLQGVRTMLPVKSILREYLSTEESDDETEAGGDEEEEEEEEETVMDTSAATKKDAEAATVNTIVDEIEPPEPKTPRPSSPEAEELLPAKEDGPIFSESVGPKTNVAPQTQPPVIVLDAPSSSTPKLFAALTEFDEKPKPATPAPTRPSTPVQKPAPAPAPVPVEDEFLDLDLEDIPFTDNESGGTKPAAADDAESDIEFEEL